MRASLLVPPRRRGAEILDAPGADPELAHRSLRDVSIANAVLGGTRAVLVELSPLWATLPQRATLLDVGTGAGDIPARARAAAERRGVTLETIGLEPSPGARRRKPAAQRDSPYAVTRAICRSPIAALTL